MFKCIFFSILKFSLIQLFSFRCENTISSQSVMSAHCVWSEFRGARGGRRRRVSRASAIRYSSHTHHLRVSRARLSSSCRHALLTPVPLRPRDARDDDDGDGWKMEKLSASINGLSWSSVSLPLDVIVSKFRLPTLVRLSHGKKHRQVSKHLVNSFKTKCCEWITNKICYVITLTYIIINKI